MWRCGLVLEMGVGQFHAAAFPDLEWQLLVEDFKW